ncbi:MAG: hypothetical protein AMXMBFR74_00700 [Parvibaculum sp.]|uniref:hypothetical protein n=1 Tax=Parvibaculum sp. TaxID=2024848 RepID=UPI0035BAA69A
MNILAIYATSYVGAFDVALSARRGDIREAEGQLAGKTRGETIQNRLARLFSRGNAKLAA